jgi:hypothetical protein
MKAVYPITLLITYLWDTTLAGCGNYAIQVAAFCATSQKANSEYTSIKSFIQIHLYFLVTS